MQMNQDQTPLIDALRAFEKREIAYFNIPAHRSWRGAPHALRELLGDRVFGADVTETDGTDDLHAATGAILQAERLAADLFGSRQCAFLVNGTTCGNEAMLLASVREKEKVLIARNAHASAWMGLVLSGAEPVWMLPRFHQEFGIYGQVAPKTVEEALQNDSEIKACLITSPTYYGEASDVRGIAEICHRHSCLLLVDEAHGTHFYFDDRFPEGAVAAGADLVAQSMHKTGGSFTQSSLLHRCSDRIDVARLEESLRLVQSTSPSYLLMASLDGARHELAMRGREKSERAIRLALRAREELSLIPGIAVLGGGGDACESQDLLRVVFSAADAGMDGITLQNELFRLDVTTEMADPFNVTAVITDGNTDEDIARLAAGVRAVTERSGKHARPEIRKREELFRMTFPEISMTPREAMMSDKKAVPLEDACEKIAGELIAPYPPGIPLFGPGERIRREGLLALRSLKALGASFHGAADPELGSIVTIQKKR